jgi:DNA-binding SARP family transcriptional activator/tetratricopeptide (TPR) repeat protein
MEFRILGPLEITAGQRRLELHGARQQVVVAMLLLGANRVVTMDRLLEAIYGEDPPPTARSQVQIGISSIRRVLASYDRETIIDTHPSGYVLRVGSGQLDAQKFTELVAEARGARESGHLEQAVGHYRDALRLWRGPAAAGIDSQLVRAAASRLDELRISSNEDRITLELELGRHHELVAELIEMVEEHPLRELLRGQLMLALYRCNRTAEALQVYRLTRRIMIDELGIEPSDRLQSLEHAILTTDPALDLQVEQFQVQSVAQQVPKLLPADIADFTGREEHIAQIRQYLIPVDDAARLAVPVVVLVGKGGVGKSCTAVHSSHGMIDHFPDGQLYADLHGSATHPVSPAQVLERFLRALGVLGTNVPENLDERAEMYRNLLAGRKVLVMLNDAISESHVLPLLPGNSTAAVIVTSRSRLTGLAGARHIEVDVFDVGNSVDLLARITGATRVQSEADAAAVVADQCGGLPLALRIAGARLAARPHWSVQQLADRLADETRRLDELRHGDMGIRPSISFSYDSAGEQARLLFRRLALLDMPVFSGWLSAALLDVPVATAENLLDDLVNAQLVEPAGSGSGSGVHCHYRFHDLIRVFARERLVAEDPAVERKAALERALGALLYVAEQAHRTYFGGDYVRVKSDAQSWPLSASLVEQLVADPLAWYESERLPLVSSVRQAAQAGFTELCWSLAVSAVALYESRIYLDEWRETHDVALEATKKAHHVRGQAAILYSMGSLHMMQQRFDLALQELTNAVQLFEKSDDYHGAALAVRHIAYLDRLGGRRDEASARYEQALTIFRRNADHIATAYVLHGIAQLMLEQSQFAAAMDLLSEALELCRAARCGRIEAQVLHRMGEAQLLLGELAGAAETFREVLTITTDIGDLIGEAYALQGIGVAELRLANFDQAREALQRALGLAVRVGERMVEGRIVLAMSELAIAVGDYRQAVALGNRAAAVFDGLKVPLYEAWALGLLNTAHTALGDPVAVLAAAAEADRLRANLSGDGPVG